MICATERRTALYRFYDAREHLLYVGISNDPWRRWREHVLAAPWYPQVKHQSVTWYDNSTQARHAESLAIRSERPKFNVAGALRPSDFRLDLRRAPLTALAMTWMCIPAIICEIANYLPSLDLLALFSILTMPLLLVIALVIRWTPWIYRFGCWMDRNFSREAVGERR